MTRASGGRRRLTDDEIVLWLAVAQTVRPRAGAHLPSIPTAPPPEPVPAQVPRKQAERRAPFLPPYSPAGQLRRETPPLAPFEKRYRQKITRGRVEIDAALDLHGLTQPDAHAALIGFLRASSANGARLVLVVTGKGRERAGGSSEPGVLRRAVPLWLRAPELRSTVIGFEEAGLPHGGLGALYVRLRRREG